MIKLKKMLSMTLLALAITVTSVPLQNAIGINEVVQGRA